MPWWKDRWLWVLQGIGALLRAVPLIVWAWDWSCVRDECTYLGLADRMVKGQGMTTSAGWLWAPGYPALLALHKAIFTEAAAIRGTQVLVAGLTAALLYQLARRGANTPESGVKAGRIAAGLYLLSPTMVFFAQSLWSECIYGALLLGGLLFFERARESARWRAAGALGAMVGCCVLFRGVATYMLPIFAAALLWRRLRDGWAWKQVAAMFAAAAITVAPYSAYATAKFGALVVSDRTLGQMMWLGNNDFPPITFDWGNGVLSGRTWNRVTSEGRKPCAERGEAMERDACQVEQGVAWIKANPGEFVARIPLRLAQLMNPHGFLTRHLRWGNWKGLPQFVDEGIILWSLGWSLLVLWGGAAGLVLKGKGARAVLISGILLYHMAAIAALAGLTRYRAPLEPLLMLYLAKLWADRKDLRAELRAEPWRLAVLAAVMLLVVPLVLWFLPAGWPWWRRW